MQARPMSTAAAFKREKKRWAPFRNGLPSMDQSAFDRLWQTSEVLAQATTAISFGIPFETIVLTMLLVLSKELRARDSGIRDLKAALHDPVSRRKFR